jgi:hypothetical protein
VTGLLCEAFNFSRALPSIIFAITVRERRLMSPQSLDGGAPESRWEKDRPTRLQSKRRGALRLLRHLTQRGVYDLDPGR